MYAVFRCGLDDGLEFISASVEDADRGPHAQPQDAGQVFCFLVRKRDQFAGSLRLRRKETGVHGNEL